MIDNYAPYIGLTMLTIFGGFLCYLSYKDAYGSDEKHQNHHDS